MKKVKGCDSNFQRSPAVKWIAIKKRIKNIFTLM